MSRTRLPPSVGTDDAQLILRHWREAVPNDRIAHLVKDATRALVRALSIRLAGHAVSFGHWTFLRVLWESDGLSQTELSRRAGVMAPTTHSALTAMQRLGYIVRRRMPDSRKKVYVFLTPRGRRLKRTLVPLAEDVNAIAAHGLPATDIATLRRMLLAIIENLARDEAAAGADMRMPSTRELGRRVAGAGPRRRATT